MDDFEALVHDATQRYRQTHPNEVEGLRYEFRIGRTGYGSGFVRANRLESTDAAAPPSESILIEDNRVVHRLVHPPSPPGWWQD